MSMVQIVAMLAHLIESGHSAGEIIELTRKEARAHDLDVGSLLDQMFHLHTQNFACSA